MSDPDKILGDYDPAHLQCRADRHRWSRRPHWATVDRYHDERITVCEDCGTRKVQLVNITTWRQIGYAKYRYAPGYLTPRSGLRLEDFREEQFRTDFARAQREGRVE